MTVKWGIIGCGDVVEHKSGPAFNKVSGSELIAVMRRDAKKAKDFAQRHGVKKYYSDIDALLKDDEINAVYIATPHYLHAQHTIRAAKYGKHILCEKPMALTVKECEEMIRACEENDVQLMVAYYRRFFPVVEKIKELLREGKIGRPITARAQVFALYHLPAGESFPWRINPQMAGGGFLTDVGSHRVDLLIYLLGKVREVAAFVDMVHFDFEIEDSSSLIMRFTNGAHGVASFHWNIATAVDELEIAGTKGRILSTDLASGDLKIYTDQGREKYRLSPPHITHLGLVENFVRSIIAGKRNCLPGEEGLKTTKVLEAIYRSSKERKVVRVS